MGQQQMGVLYIHYGHQINLSWLYYIFKKFERFPDVLFSVHFGLDCHSQESPSSTRNSFKLALCQAVGQMQSSEIKLLMS